MPCKVAPVRLLLRLFANCPDDAAALPLGARIAAALPGLVMTQMSSPERYWKMPELFEFTFAVHPADRSTVDAIVALSPASWTHSGDEHEASSVWNRRDDAMLLLPEVAWVELILTGG